MEQINFVKITFPEIRLEGRAGHKLRGFFGNYFREKSPLLHNHYENGELRYKYPLVQYKVIEGVPTLIALNEGAEVLTSLFLKIDKIEIEERFFPVSAKNLWQGKVEVGTGDSLKEYQFQSPWLALSQENYRKFQGQNEDQRQALLEKLLIGNILSFYKGVGVWVQERIMLKGKFTGKAIKFKDQALLGFEGEFVSNVLLPSGIGLGKSVSRGYGMVRQK
ncbi:MAG: CRISPR-associated endonuclease Cas6 [Bacteroidia bacterium]|nr:CRISPR-associated endonuclease Cas6 [Bacteroidia bacterium]